MLDTITSNLPTILSWSACALLLWGLKLIGDKKKSGFYLALIAETLWIVWGMLTHSYALTVMSVVIMMMYIRAIYLHDKIYEKLSE